MVDKPLRIWRSPYSPFYEGDVLAAPKVYSLKVLRGIAEAGFSAIWIRGILRDIVRTKVFPELGKKSAAHLRALRTVIGRAQKAGLQVFLYAQPPMGLPTGDPFWKKHPEAKGAVYDYFGERPAAMCVSAPEVRRFLHEAAETLARRLPGLGGLITITASEHISHCFSHYHTTGKGNGWSKGAGQPLGCERCQTRQPRDVVIEILTSLSDGLKAAGKGTKLVAWNWSWSFYEPEPQAAIIRRLPRDIILMAGFERGDTKTILGKKRKIDEYSLSFAGPSKRFVKSYREARKRGLRVMAKLQFATTHELATVPNLPLVGSLYEKAKAMRRLRVGDYLGCWNFGNMLSVNTTAMNHFLNARRLPPRDRALRQFAADYFPGCAPRTVAAAWEQFGKAMDYYPFDIPFMYHSPLNYALQHPIQPGPLTGVPVGRSWLRDERGDELSASIQAYTLAEIIKGLGELWRRWAVGVALLEEGLRDCDHPHAVEERTTARVVGHCFRSGWNVYRAYKLRKNWKGAHRAKLKAIAADEREHLADALPLVAGDDRQGFHSEAQHRMFTPAGIRRKIKQLDRLLHSGTRA